jgi:hypothetical protein
MQLNKVIADHEVSRTAGVIVNKLGWWWGCQEQATAAKEAFPRGIVTACVFFIVDWCNKSESLGVVLKFGRRLRFSVVWVTQLGRRDIISPSDP